jgi:hypothetical protein
VSVNKYQPHVYILPEDEANKELAIGFLLGVNKDGQTKVLNVAGGWNVVLEQFQSVHIAEMERYSARFMILMLDFDGKDRRKKAKAIIPEHLKDRVFVLGVWTNPEALKHDLGSFEDIGLKLADDCRQATDSTWRHRLLQHNAIELQRLCVHIFAILF